MQVRAIDPSQVWIEDCDFYHSMRFPDGSEVRGSWDIRECFSDYIGNVELNGKAVLDVGTASGFVAFETERRGAQVTAFEVESYATVPHVPFARNLYYNDHSTWTKQSDQHLEQLKNAFWYAHHRFKSRVQVIYGDLFEIGNLVSPVDVVIAGALIEHVSDPIRAIGELTKVARETLVLASTPVIETDEMLMRPISTLDNPVFDYTWFELSTGLLRRVLNNVDFELVMVGSSRQYYAANDVWANRPTVVAKRIEKL
jgi:2-polyprenyl-3-methyl-5-hydroxy-6-metoxy-1,4-benzoquinol methylase